ncbi:hypothetical protein NPIL_198181 [Nephila pilipes]|uniref:Uncharacterized protein n=1 Tax=Nephila pilipes TaxID=299642 RepID=A0A8X6NTM4_NEPPI|nr:hypothetical protein NPIL_198181 [Nephila pilipes]
MILELDCTRAINCFSFYSQILRNRLKDGVFVFLKRTFVTRDIGFVILLAQYAVSVMDKRMMCSNGGCTKFRKSSAIMPSIFCHALDEGCWVVCL